MYEHTGPKSVGFSCKRAWPPHGSTTSNSVSAQILRVHGKAENVFLAGIARDGSQERNDSKDVDVEVDFV